MLYKYLLILIVISMEIANLLYYINLIVDILFTLYICLHIYFHTIGGCLAGLDHQSGREERNKKNLQQLIMYVFMLVITIIGFCLGSPAYTYYKLVQKIICSGLFVVLALFYLEKDDKFDSKFIPFHFLYLSSLGLQIVCFIYKV